MEVVIMNQLAREKTVSEKLQVSVQTLRNWRHKGVGPPYVKLGRAVRYDLQQVSEFLDDHKIATNE